jgi:NAD+ diphosphatase
VVTPEYTTAVVEQAAHAALALRPCSSVPAGAERYFLGLAGGDPVFAVRGPQDLVGDRWVDLREIGAALDDRDAGLLTTAVALARWHDRHPTARSTARRRRWSTVAGCGGARPTAPSTSRVRTRR